MTADFAACSAEYSGRPTTGAFGSVCLTRPSIRSYPGRSRIAAIRCAIPPVVGAYERPLSFSTITSGRSLAPAMLFSASQAIPPVSAPSPMTATTVRSRSLRRANALAIPSA